MWMMRTYLAYRLLSSLQALFQISFSLSDYSENVYLYGEGSHAKATCLSWGRSWYMRALPSHLSDSALSANGSSDLKSPLCLQSAFSCSPRYAGQLPSQYRSWRVQNLRGKFFALDSCLSHLVPCQQGSAFKAISCSNRLYWTQNFQVWHLDG